MARVTEISWTESTWNPVTGCDKVSPGCAHCYAETFAERWRGIPGHPYEQGFDLKLHPARLELPLRWKKPSMIFVNSMSDLFHEQIPDEYIAEVFAVMATADRHTYQVLSKRPERMRDLLASGVFRRAVAALVHDARKGCVGDLSATDLDSYLTWPLPGVWLGVSIENRRFVDRADVLRDTPAAVRFISAEPLLGPLAAELDLHDIDWVICGGESGPKHRPIDPEWVRALRDACQATGLVCCGWSRTRDAGGRCCGQPDDEGPRTAFFLKQWGGVRPKANGRTLDGRTWDEMPVRGMETR